MDTLSPCCGLVPSPPPTTARLRPTSMWCEISAKGGSFGRRRAKKKQTNVEPPPFPDPDPDPDPGRPYGGQLWQTAVASADRELRSLRASHGRLSHLLLFFFNCCCCVSVDRATVYCCVALSEWSCREKGKKNNNKSL